MGKIVFWIVVFFVILLGLRFLNGARSRQSSRDRESRERPRELPPAEPTVRCEACGVYLPRSEALATDTGFRCGDPACPRRH
jgi:uncharacterized protein